MPDVQIEINDAIGHPSPVRFSWKAMMVQTDPGDPTHIRYIVEEGREPSQVSAAKAVDEASLRIERSWDALTGEQETASNNG